MTTPVLPLIRYVCMSIGFSSIYGSLLTPVPLGVRRFGSESIRSVCLHGILLTFYLSSTNYELTRGGRPTLEKNTEEA